MELDMPLYISGVLWGLTTSADKVLWDLHMESQRSDQMP